MYEKCRSIVVSEKVERSVKLAGYIRKSGSAGVVRNHLFVSPTYG